MADYYQNVTMNKQLYMQKMSFTDRISGLKGPFRSLGIDVIQVNLGYRCNMLCKHCHVQAGPFKGEIMDWQTIDEVLTVLRGSAIQTLDITGGAPELNPHFRYLVQEARRAGRHVIVRSNLTIFFEKGMEDLPEFYWKNGVELIASLPYFLKENVDRVRGDGTFEKSISALKKLNSLGYGSGTGSPALSLLYNPPGDALPAAQKSLEEEFKRELAERHGIYFNNLYTVTNMPIGRFRDFLERTNKLDQYLDKLKRSFNPSAVDGVMCRHTISIGWDGRLFDCDFNQMIGLGILKDYPQQIGDFDFTLLRLREIAVDDHCYGCTAGAGST